MWEKKEEVYKHCTLNHHPDWVTDWVTSLDFEVGGNAEPLVFQAFLEINPER